MSLSLQLDVYQQNGALLDSQQIVYRESICHTLVAVQTENQAFDVVVPKGDFPRLVAATILAMDAVLQTTAYCANGYPKIRQVKVSLVASATNRVLRAHWLAHWLDATAETFTKLCKQVEDGGQLWRMLQMVAVVVAF